MDIPTLPVFDEEEEADEPRVASFFSSGGLLAICYASIYISRRMKRHFYDAEVVVVRRIWLNRFSGSLKVSLAINFCILVNIMVALVFGLNLAFDQLENSLSFLHFDQSFGLVLTAFIFSQLTAIYIRMAPETWWEFLSNLKHIPRECRKFALVLDIVGALCALPTITVLLNGEYAAEGRQLTLGNIVFFTIILSVAVLINGPTRRHKTDPRASLPVGVQATGTLNRSDCNGCEEFPLNLVIRRPSKSKDNIQLTDSRSAICGFEITPSCSNKVLEDNSRPALIINAEGCSPALLTRLRQMGDLQTRTSAAERRVSLRSHQVHSSPDLTEVPPLESESVM